MTNDAHADIASVADRITPIDAGAAVIGAHFIGDTAVLVLAEEALFFASPDGGGNRIAVHEGGILASASDGKRIITSGDDGKVMMTDRAGSTAVVSTDAKHRWIDHVATNGDAIAWSAGKEAFVRTGKGDIKSVAVASSVGGLAFLPKGFRLAIAQYNGVALWFPNAAAAPDLLQWKGSHLDVTVSPDGKFLITSMQEPTLHGWRLVDGKDMRMSGYSAKVRSFGWSAGGKWLATSGSNQLILWPFQSKDGPMGKQPRILAPAQHRVVVVACHPTQDVVATAYENGLILLVRIEDGAEILVRSSGAAVTALAWNAAGSVLAFGTESGEAGLLPL
jgi:WD40 repeat protein